jgi:hypothetical protein
MVPILELACVITLAALGVSWFRRTNIYRNHRSHGSVDPGQHGRQGFGMYSRMDPPNRQSHRE